MNTKYTNNTHSNFFFRDYK